RHLRERARRAEARIFVGLHGDGKAGQLVEAGAYQYREHDVTHAAGEEESLRVLEALAKRVRNVEAKVPTPAGLGQLRPPSTPL
ncbi:MAG TPA: hypothetical protein PKW66_26180, partial [Polyangiaceae bacterium]|nr:hypothetical protein [Polyangiaceae bacterium]